MKDYLEEREPEVITIMMSVFDQEYAMKMALAAERQDGRQEGREEGREEEKRNVVMNLHECNTPLELMAKAVGRSCETVKEWIAEAQ